MEYKELKILTRNLKDFKTKVKKTPFECKDDVKNLLIKIDDILKIEVISNDVKKVKELARVRETLVLFQNNITSLEKIKK